MIRSYENAQKPSMLSRVLQPRNKTSCSHCETYGKDTRVTVFLFNLLLAGGYSMPRGRQKDRDLRRKHRKNQQRIKGLEVARREKGKKK